MSRARIGDVLEIATAKGLAYAQVTHKHDVYGALLRVLPGFYGVRPVLTELRKLVSSPARYSAFTPADAGVSWKIFTPVGRMDVPKREQSLPVFKIGLQSPGEIRAHTWRLWDGERETSVAELTPEQAALPNREIISPRLLVLRLEAGWTPATDSTVTGVSLTADDSDENSPMGERHFLYFSRRNAAQEAAQRLKGEGFLPELRRSTGRADWLVLVPIPKVRSVAELQETQQHLEQLAHDLGGDYNGWDAAVGATGSAH